MVANEVKKVREERRPRLDVRPEEISAKVRNGQLSFDEDCIDFLVAQRRLFEVCLPYFWLRDEAAKASGVVSMIEAARSKVAEDTNCPACTRNTAAKDLWAGHRNFAKMFFDFTEQLHVISPASTAEFREAYASLLGVTLTRIRLMSRRNNKPLVIDI